MCTVPAHNFWAPTRAKLIAAARFMPGVWRRRGGLVAHLRPPRRLSGSVHDGRIDDALQLAAEVEASGRHQLRHKYHRHVFLGVHEEDRGGRAAPVVVAGAEIAGGHLVHGGSETQAETDTL